MRLAIIVGHTDKSPGATNYLGESEYSFNTKIASMMKDYLSYNNVQTKVFFRDVKGLRGIAQELEAWKPMMSLELHFNAFNKKAYGCESIIYKNSPHFLENVYLADHLTDDLADAFLLRQRHTVKLEDGKHDGVYARPKGRGVNNLRLMHNAGVKYVQLIEPCFGNFKTKESASIFEAPGKYAITLSKSIMSFFDVKDREEDAPEKVDEVLYRKVEGAGTIAFVEV